MNAGRILIRADASPEIGTGHVMRCLALAQAWQDIGGEAVFVMAESTTAIRSRLAADNILVVSISAMPGSVQDAAQFRELVHKQKAEWVVLDSYRFDVKYQENVRTVARRVLCIDDLGAWERYSADIVLNQNINASENWYRHSRLDAQLLLGPHFCLLRREFRSWRTWQRDFPLVGGRILITLGGSTPLQIAKKVMEAIDLVEVPRLEAFLVLGGSSRDIAAIESEAQRFAGKISVHKDVSDMAPLMSQSDIAVSAAGSTCWELCLLGLPSVLLDLAANQTPVALELHRLGCALHVGHADTVSVQALTATIENLLRSPEERRSLSQRSRQLVDGRGANRVVSAMCALTERGSALVESGLNI